MKMVTAARFKSNQNVLVSIWKVSRFIMIGLLFSLAFVLAISGQTKKEQLIFEQAQNEFRSGDYLKAIDLASNEIEKARKEEREDLIATGLNLIAVSQLSLEKFTEAETSLNEAFELLSKNNSSNYQKALLHINFAWLNRSQRKFKEALEHSKKAFSLAPSIKEIQIEHYLNIGRIFFSLGYDASAIIWLEKAESLFGNETPNGAKIEIYRFLALAWSAKLNYQAALKYAEKWAFAAENSPYKYKHRQSLFEWANILSITGQKQKAFAVLEKGLKLSLDQKNSYQSRNFLHSLLLNSLYENDLAKAAKYLQQLEQLDVDKQFDYEITLGKAVIAAFRKENKVSETLFAELDKQEYSSEFLLPGWKKIVAEKNNDWDRMIKINEELLQLNLKYNFRDDLPVIYFDFAKAYLHLNKRQEALENLEKSIKFVEESRRSENINLSLGILETYHNAYRLLAGISSNENQKAFELTDFLKARLLKDKIDNSPLRSLPEAIQAVQRLKLEELTLKYIDDQSSAQEIEQIEKSLTTQIPTLDLNKPDLSGLNDNANLSDSAVISYFFTLDKKLLAFVWEKGQPLRTVPLTLTEDEIDTLAKTVPQKIKNLIFFKRDGRELHDKLLKPLKVTAKHLIIIPDKSLWKIPFQALSPDGEKYLIEEKLISYAPSVSILLAQLKEQKPLRRSLLAFANSYYENRILQFVNSEASSVSEIYGSKPVIGATVNDFTRQSENADILHFSMHAEVDNEEPLNSFLGFRKFGKDEGSLTVEELLSIKLKKKSLVFLASCDTNTVLSGEGLVSLAWAMMGSGATSVISSGWEANDKSTAVFTNNFYRSYRQGSSAAKAIQKASVELIKDKSGNMHEPYYWADFTLNGDFR